MNKQEIINKKCFCVYSNENESKLLELGFKYWIGRGNLEKISSDNTAQFFILEDDEIKTGVNADIVNFNEIKIIDNEFNLVQ